MQNFGKMQVGVSKWPVRLWIRYDPVGIEKSLHICA